MFSSELNSNYCGSILLVFYREIPWMDDSWMLVLRLSNLLVQIKKKNSELQSEKLQF